MNESKKPKQHLKDIGQSLMALAAAIFTKEKKITPNPVSTSSFHFLQERPETETDAIKFGHREITEALKLMVCEPEGSLTIGLFGTWGSGKSTIVENLRNELQKTTIPLIIFDVWKHDGDSLRRTFLSEMDKQLSEEPFGEAAGYVTKEYELTKRLYQSETKSSEKPVFKFAKLLLHASAMTLFFVPSIFVLWLISKFLNVDLLKEVAESTFGKSLGALFLTMLTGGFLYRFFDTFIKSEKVEEKKEKLQDPHEFEEEFKNILKNLSDKVPRIVISFDNMDRVSGDQALKVMATIKTFLETGFSKESKPVLFLVPCDADALREHILSTSKTARRDYVEEYLRKFFHTGIWIPEFFDDELENFALAKLQATGISEFAKNPYLAWLIIKAFNRNPRQIVQFINILVANYLLMKGFCESGHFHDIEFYKKNVPQLARYLLLKQRFPHIMELYRESFVYDLDDSNFNIRFEETKVEGYKEFRSLVVKTQDIQISSLEPFFKFRHSADEQLLTAEHGILEKVISGDATVIWPKDKQIGDAITAISNFFRNKFKKFALNLTKLDFLRNVLSFSDVNKFSYTPLFYREMLNFCINDLNVTIALLPPSLLNNELIAKHGAVRKADLDILIQRYLANEQSENHQQTNFEIEIAGLVVAYEKSLSKETEKLLKNFLFEHLYDPPVIDQFLGELAKEERFFPKTLKQEIVQAVQQLIKGDEYERGIAILAKFSDLADNQTMLVEIIHKGLTEVLADRDRQPDQSFYSDILRLLNNLDIEADRKAITSMAENMISDISRFELDADFFRILLALYRLTRNSRADDMLTSSLERSDEDTVHKLLEADDKIDYWPDNAIEAAIIRGPALPFLRDFLIERLPSNLLWTLLVEMIKQAHYERSEDVLYTILPDSEKVDLPYIVAALESAIDTAIRQKAPSLTDTLNLLFILLDNGVNKARETVAKVLGKLTVIGNDSSTNQKALAWYRQYLEKIRPESILTVQAILSQLHVAPFDYSEEHYRVVAEDYDLLTPEERESLRSIVYHQLLLDSNDDLEKLKLTLEVLKLRFAPKPDLNDCLSSLQDFANIAEYQVHGIRRNYYLALLKELHRQLRPYNQESFKQLKETYKTLIAQDDEIDEL